MALDHFSFTGEAASRAMIAGLTSKIRDELRRIILERIEPDIQAAVDAGLSAFKATIEAHAEPWNMSTTVRILIERKDHSPQETGHE